MKQITITGLWLNSFRKLERPVRLRQVVDLADKHGWPIRIAGESWGR